ncbi:MAG: hypothetical protein ABSB49_02725 [Polyangia bacterium]
MPSPTGAQPTPGHPRSAACEPQCNVALTYSLTDLVATALAAGVVAVWAGAAAGAFSPLVLLACLAAFLSFYLVGSLCASWRDLAAGTLFDLPLRLLVGYIVVNTSLFALAWLSPLGLIADFAILLTGAILLFLVKKPRRRDPDEQVGLLVLGVSLVAATLWCQDSIRPTFVDEHAVWFKPWIDGFYHAVHIRSFGASHGTIEDFRLADVPARLYHYGDYLTPALIWRVGGISSYSVFAGVLAPLAVFFSGLGAYALVASFWGPWPGLAACAALLLLPDGVQQGMRNTFMSYHWLTQISPSASYGLAVLAAAWLFVLRGCTQGNRLQVLAGWLTGGIVIVYKAHFFIASALPLLIVPPLFFQGSRGLGRWKLGKRAMGAGAALAVYLAAIKWVQKVPGVPPIRLDGSCLAKILDLVKSFAPPGALRTLLYAHIGRGHSATANILLGGAFVLLAALGLFVPLLVVLALRLRRRTFPLLIVFPFLLVVNFLTMFLGLAMDFKRSTPDELSHRPVMLMYFGVVAWLGGAAGLLLVEARKLGRFARPTILGLLVLLLTVPALLGEGVQRMWAMRGFAPVRVPLGLVQAAQYLHDHSEAREVFQDSQFDRTYTVAALSERRAYVEHTMTLISFNRQLVDQRSSVIEDFMQLRDPAAVIARARELGVNWFLLDPGDRVEWPGDITDRPAFARDGYRLYRF